MIIKNLFLNTVGMSILKSPEAKKVVYRKYLNVCGQLLPDSHHTWMFNQHYIDKLFWYMLKIYLYFGQKLLKNQFKIFLQKKVQAILMIFVSKIGLIQFPLWLKHCWHIKNGIWRSWVWISRIICFITNINIFSPSFSKLFGPFGKAVCELV